ncbi:integrase [Gossypium australe]|uniref:Integrase n=1 Tax=Gossypium australe TaxID=47621 RepID=A0A5B6UVM6_9ROSI|nr:integrase [Gossypium australe]
MFDLSGSESRTSGSLWLLQSVMIPKWKWERVIMDFISGLPLTLRKKVDMECRYPLFLIETRDSPLDFRYNISSVGTWIVGTSNIDSRGHVTMLHH